MSGLQELNNIMVTKKADQRHYFEHYKIGKLTNKCQINYFNKSGKDCVVVALLLSFVM